MNRAKPDTITWIKTGRQGGKPAYQNIITGDTIAYDCNRWQWVVQSTGHCYKTLTVAQYESSEYFRSQVHSCDGVAGTHIPGPDCR